MTVVRNSRARRAGRTIVSALGLAAVIATLAGCAADDIAGGMATPASATAAAPAAAPAAPAAAPTPATTAAAEPKAAPRVLSPTEINEQCWMSNEVNKLKDLDAKAKLVDKCVAERMKAQGM
jgi:hypothetical protein